MSRQKKSDSEKKKAFSIMLPSGTIDKVMKFLQAQGKDKNEWFHNVIGSILGIETKKEEKQGGAKITPEALRALAEQMEGKEVKKVAGKKPTKKTGGKAGRPPKGSGTKGKPAKKKVVAKKKVPAKKKVVAKKVVAKKPAIKKAPAKKAVVKKAPAKKATPKKEVVKKAVNVSAKPSKAPAPATATVPVSVPTPKIEANKEAPVENTATMGN